jgi:hypothetical protein
MIMRSVQGLAFGLEKIRAPVPIKTIFLEVIKNLADQPKVTIKNQQDLLQARPVPLSSSCARHLRDLATEKTKPVVDMTMPVRSLEELELLVPEDTLIKIEETHNIEQIKADAQRAGYLPCDLFYAETTHREYKAWLE